ncbi:Espin [Fusarium keratoplasticum]|uniref:Espin n=1 Tax=Fusarium keratoplasticum TaxID=1328300 RepID=A0ACC0QDP9_9HYPO|nr:Espin [Fusarium keratoplasticum]KAI8648686.1 Espin [Fusarium keratoplasticum]
MNGRHDMVKSLIEAGAAMNILDASGNTPLLWASYKGHMRVVEYLWEDTNQKLRDNDGRTALHLAATAGMEEVVRWLIDMGADKEAKNRAGKTPLYYAARNGHEAVVGMLE